MPGNRQEGDKPGQGDRFGGNQPAVVCPVCGKQVIDLHTAIADRDSGGPIHFDCALERVAAAERLGPNEKIIYSGGGCFAVVEYRGASETAFVVKRRIPFEKEGAKHEWRTTLRSKGL
jgi:hypothetical protein